MVRDKVLSAGFSKFAPSSAVLFTTLAMVSSSNPASYAERAKAKSPVSSQSPTPSSTSTTDVEKPGDEAFHGSLLNGLNPSHGSTPNFWAVRKEQMAAKAVSTATSSSSSPTLAASPSLPASAPSRSTRNVNGVDLNDTSSWPQVTAASTPTKDKTLSRDTPTPTPTPTPKKSEKTKWVPIPPTELQAAADAVTRGRSSPKHASATTSTHSSPKTSARGRRLPNDDPSHDNRRRSPSRLAHAYTHPFNSPTRPTSTFVLPTPASHQEPHHPPLTRQKRPATPARSGPVAGYRDIDDLKVGEGRLVMFGSIGAPSSSTELSPLHRGLGLDIGSDGDRKRREEVEVGRPVGGGFTIGIHPDELARSKITKARRSSAPSNLGLFPEIVDLTDGTWLRDIILVNKDTEESRERKWEFGTSRRRPDTTSPSTLSSHPPHPPQMYPPAPPPPNMGYAPPLPLPMSMSAPESVLGDPMEYDMRALHYGEPYAAGMDRERRGGYGGQGRRGRYAGGRGGPNGNSGRGYGGRRGNGPPQHYGPPLPSAYVPPSPYPPPPPPPPGPDGYYMGSPYSLPYPPYVPPPMPPYAAPPIMDQSMRPAPVPMPVTVTSFPIDPTRWYLLGQIEYYFSVQNLCVDFWLRKQMDNRGWVPISVIASFNRVRQLTYDVGLVRDVMGLSILVEVQGDKVRLRDRQWVPFILPDAAASDVPEPMEQLQQQQQAHAMQSTSESPYSQQEEVEDEEVVFVMAKEGEERNTEADSWTPREAVGQTSQS